MALATPASLAKNANVQQGPAQLLARIEKLPFSSWHLKVGNWLDLLNAFD
jgi:hypothetical protein